MATDSKSNDQLADVFRLTFFKAPWRRKEYKFRDPMHYIIIGIACTTYLFLVGTSLTYLSYVRKPEHAQGHAMGIPSHYIGPMLLTLGTLLIVSLSVMCAAAIYVTCWRYRTYRARLEAIILGQEEEEEVSLHPQECIITK